MTAEHEGMDLRLLGPVRAWRDEAELPLGSARRAAVLAVLALHAGHAVSRQQLVTALWGDEPPASATGNVYTYVSTLRKRLLEGGVERAVIRTQPPGYLAELNPGELDSSTFENLVADARQRRAGNDLVGAGQAYRSALTRWRGEALGGIGDVLRTEAARLEDLRLSVLEERIAVDLALGREGELVTEVRALSTQHPLRERLLGYLMVVLYRLGRQAEALEAFQQGRRLLAEELGIDPGPELRSLYQAVLRADQDMLGPPPNQMGQGRSGGPASGSAGSPGRRSAGASPRASPRPLRPPAAGPRAPAGACARRRAGR